MSKVALWPWFSAHGDSNQRSLLLMLRNSAKYALSLSRFGKLDISLGISYAFMAFNMEENVSPFARASVSLGDNKLEISTMYALVEH